jgi:hypothetical protein
MNIDISEIEKKMEEMANAPREEMGKRTPGEKGKYEEQNLALANGMLLHNDHSSKRSTLASPKVLKYPRGG